MLANGTGKAMVKTGGDTWFFLTADYAFGHALERDTAAVVEKPTAARCSARFVIRSTPPTSRRSCCRRRPRRPRSSGSPTPAATPSTRSSRRPSSASSRAGRSLAGLLVFASDVARARPADRAGPDADRDLVLGHERRQPRLDQALAGRAQRAGKFPTMVQAGVYAGIAALSQGVAALKSGGRRQGDRRQDEGDADRRSAVRQGHDPRRRPQAAPGLSVRGEEAGGVASTRATSTSCAPPSRRRKRSGRSRTAAARW